MALGVPMLLRSAGSLRDKRTNTQVIGIFRQRGALLVEDRQLLTGALEALRDVAEASLDE